MSETSATDRSTFTQVGDVLQPRFFDGTNWTHYSVDLSAYAGKSVYIAIEAFYTNSLGGFIDNVEIDHVGGITNSIKSLNTDNAANRNEPVYNLSGQRVNKSYKGIVLQHGKKTINK